MAAKTEDRIEHSANRVGERRVMDECDRSPNSASAPKEARSIGLELHIANGFAFDDGEMRCPDLRVVG